MDTKLDELKLAMAYVQRLEQDIAEQRERIKRLSAMGTSTMFAEHLLLALQASLGHLDGHLFFVTESIHIAKMFHANEN